METVAIQTALKNQDGGAMEVIPMAQILARRQLLSLQEWKSVKISQVTSIAHADLIFLLLMFHQLLLQWKHAQMCQNAMELCLEPNALGRENSV